MAKKKSPTTTTAAPSSSPKAPQQQGRTSHDESDDYNNNGRAEADAAAGRQTRRKQQQQAPAATKKKSKLTKRQQKDLERNNTNGKHHPHPRIQSAEARSDQHVRMAGLSGSNKKKKKEEEEEGGDDPGGKGGGSGIEIQFGRMLGSSEPKVRHAAVLKLKRYLRARCAPRPYGGGDDDDDAEGGGGEGRGGTGGSRGISELELLKIWKALWYTLYMADHVAVQAELSKHLSELLWCVAGTEEEDEYAGQVYLDTFDNDDDDSSSSSGSADEEGEERELNAGKSLDDEDSSNSDWDDGDIVMEEIANTLDRKLKASRRDDEGESSNSDCSSGDSSCTGDSTSSTNDDADDDLDDSLVPHCRGAHLVSLLVSTFFQTLHREWGNMDKYRVDKFYALSRLVLHQVLKYMAIRHWNLGIVRLMNDAVWDKVLSRTPNGLRFHVIDVVLEELAAVHASEAPMHLTEATFVDVLEPYFVLAQTGGPDSDDLVQQRVVDKILVPFLRRYCVLATATDGDDAADQTEGERKDKNDSNLTFDQVHVGTVAQFIFDIASEGHTKDKYRKGLYDVYKMYKKQLKRSGPEKDVDLSLSEEGDHSDEYEINAEEDGGVVLDDVNTREPETRAPEQDEETAGESKKDTAKAGSNKKQKKKKKSLAKENKEKLEAAKGPEDPVERFNSSSDDARRKDDTAGSIEEKRKKKRKTNRHDPKTDGREGPTENEIIISVSDQKVAQSTLREQHKHGDTVADVLPAKKKRKTSEKRKEKGGDDSMSDGKKVKFGVANKARSWKASMKGLRTKDPAISPSPEKGILRNKDALIKKAKAQKRKKAIDYF